MKLYNVIAADRISDSRDVISLKKELARRGYYQVPDYGLTEFPDSQLFESIKEYQRDNALRVDGIIKPEGKTLLSLNEDSRVGVKSPVFTCTNCSGPHGGSKGDLCPWCDIKK